MNALPNATLGDMQEWATSIMRRAPDYLIGENYIRRWWIIPRNPWCNIYLHEILGSDDDRAFHDHPWMNSSFLIKGSYIEHTPEGVVRRNEGDYVIRGAQQMHRLEVDPGSCAISLFITGPKLREWGFDCPQGWVHWQDFTNPDDPSQVGRGCGEPGDLTPVAPFGKERAK